MHKASGPFEVTIVPAREDDKAEGSVLGRMALEKQFHGALEATSKGEMLTAMTNIKTSAGYVAIERVTGTLEGRPGSFVLQHSGTASKQGQQLTVSVVPDSGSGGLRGLVGTMAIRISEGKHFYDFEYRFDEGT